MKYTRYVTRPFLASVTLLLLSAAASCGGANAEGGSFLGGRVVILSEKSHGNFDDTSPRVRKADADITKLLGHPISFYFDAALVPRWSDGFEVLSIAAIEVAADALSKLRERAPDVFAWSAPLLKRIEWDYSATNEYTKYDFDAKTGILRIVLTPRNENADSEEAIRFSLGRAYAAVAGSQFASPNPTSMSPADRAKYVDYLLGFGYGQEKQKKPPSKDEEDIDPVQARVTMQIIAAYDAYKSDPALELKLRHALIEQARHYSYVRHAHADKLQASPPDSDARRGEQAYVGWLNANLFAFPEGERLRIYDEMAFADRDDKERAFPGLDVIGIWQRTLTMWLSAGHPNEAKRDEDRDRQRWFETVLGRGPDERDSIGCRSENRVAYMMLAKDNATRDKMFAAAFVDEASTKLMMAALLGLKDPSHALAFWRASMKNDASFRAVTRIMAGYAGRCSHENEIFDSLPAMWKDNTQPARRGFLLTVVRDFGSHRDDFPRWFGPLTREEWEAYLDAEPEPFREMHYQWPLLGKGYAHGAPVVARLDRWLTEDVRKNESYWPETMDTLARDLCSESAIDDLKKLNAWLEQRANQHPSELRQMQNALEHSRPGGCPKH